MVKFPTVQLSMVQLSQDAPKHLDQKRPAVMARFLAKNEDGFLLLAVLFMLAIILLSLAIAAPKMAMDLQRDKEVETVHRGMEYARAVRMYYRKFGGYPTSIDQLVGTGEGNTQRFLRKRYIDPLTGKNDWRLIHLGESQLLAASSAAQIGTPAANMPGTSPTGGNGINGGSTSNTGFGSSGSGFGGSSSGFGSSSAGGSSPSAGGLNFGGSSSGFGASSSGFGSNSAGGSSPSAGGINFGSSGTDSSGQADTGTGSSAFGTPGATVGAPIVGVGLPLTKASIIIYKKQDHYNKWEFVYDPTTDLGGALGQNGTGGANGITQPGMTNGINGANPGTGMGNGAGGLTGGSGFGNNSGFGSGSGFGSSPGSGSSPGFSNGPGFGSNSGTSGSPAAPPTDSSSPQ